MKPYFSVKEKIYNKCIITLTSFVSKIQQMKKKRQNKIQHHFKTKKKTQKKTNDKQTEKQQQQES